MNIKLLKPCRAELLNKGDSLNTAYTVYGWNASKYLLKQPGLAHSEVKYNQMSNICRQKSMVSYNNILINRTEQVMLLVNWQINMV